MLYAVIILAAVLLALELILSLALRCRRSNTHLAALRGWRYAHRGFHDKPQIPENSLPAFRRAVAHGFGAELDVHLLRDGTLAVFHDSDLIRCTGAEGILEDLTLEQMKSLHLEGTDEQIPLLDEVLALFEGKAPLIIELKAYKNNQRALAEAVLRRLDSYRGEFCIESFDPFVLIAVKKLRPDICRGQLSKNFVRDPNGLPPLLRVLCTNLVFNFLTVPDFIAYEFDARSNRCLRRCVRLWGAQEVSWTIRRRQDLLACERDGCIPIFECFDPDA